MTLSFKKRALLLALAGTLALAACDDNNSGSPAGSNPPPATQAVGLSALISTLFASSTTDTALPMEINTVAIDTNSNDVSVPNTDPNYARLVGT